MTWIWCLVSWSVQRSGHHSLALSRRVRGLGPVVCWWPFSSCPTGTTTHRLLHALYPDLAVAAATLDGRGRGVGVPRHRARRGVRVDVTVARRGASLGTTAIPAEDIPPPRPLQHDCPWWVSVVFPNTPLILFRMDKVKGTVVNTVHIWRTHW